MNRFGILILIASTMYHGAVLYLLNLKPQNDCASQWNADLALTNLRTKLRRHRKLGVTDLEVIKSIERAIDVPDLVSETNVETESFEEDLEHTTNTSQSSKAGAWMVFCVISARRNTSYLIPLLRSLQSEISRTTLPKTIDVAILDVSIDPTRLDIAQAMTEFSNFTFWSLKNKSYENCTVSQMINDAGEEGRPPCSVRQQTRDLAASLDQCSALAHPDGWVTAIEDDTELCPGALLHMTQILHLMSDTIEAWRFAVFSTFFSAVAIHHPKLRGYTALLRARVASQPVDHVIWEPWADGDSFEYQGNLVRHSGVVSAFEYRNAPAFREQFDEMRFSPRQTACNVLSLEESAVVVFDKNAQRRAAAARSSADELGTPGSVPPPAELPK